MSRSLGIPDGSSLLRAIRNPGVLAGRRLAAVFGLYVLCLAFMLFLASLLVLLADARPADVAEAMWNGSFGSSAALSNTFDNAAPLLAVAIGAAVANRSGLFNIGQEGQLTIGVGFAVYLAIEIPGPGSARILYALVGGMIGGGLWAGVAALLRFRFSVNEVISTLLLNFVAFQALTYALDRTFLLKPGDLVGALPPQSANLPRDARLPTLDALIGVPTHIGIVIGICLALVAAVVVARTRWGRRVELSGANPLLARRVGIDRARTGAAALVLAGATAGLAGAFMLTGVVYRVDPGFSNNVGWNGLLVALVARDKPLVAVPVAIAFGAIHAGGNLLASTGVPRFLVDVVQAAVILGAILPPAILDFVDRWRSLRPRQTSASAGDVLMEPT